MHNGRKMTLSVPNIDTGYRIVAGSIDTATGPTGYRVAAERILHGSVDTGCFISGETIYRKPRLDTGFSVFGGVIWGPGSELPFLAQPVERPLAKTTKIAPAQANTPGA